MEDKECTPKDSHGTTTLTLRIPVAAKKRLEVLAAKEERSINWMANKILEEAMQQKEAA